MKTLVHVADLIFNRPLLVRSEAAAAVVAGLGQRLGVEPGAYFETLAKDASPMRGQPVQTSEGDTLYQMANGVATIPVHGKLVNRGAWIGSSSGLTSYEGLETQLRAAATDSAVTSIVLDMNSPGGEATGCMELGALVRQISGSKPVVAFVNGMAASAAYAIAAGASRIVTTPTGMTGSVGVVFMHIDRSKALEQAGIKPTLIHAGAHKVDGNPYESLSDEVFSRIQAEINALYDVFVAHVAELRGIDAAAVRATEAGVLMGKAAVETGLADALGTYESVLLSLNPRQKGAFGGLSMSNDTHISLADHTAALAAARNEGLSAGVARVKAILTHAEADGRAEMAKVLAFDTAMTAEEAAKVLAASPKVVVAAEAATKPAPRLVPVPNVGADADQNHAFTASEKRISELKSAVSDHMRRKA